MQVQLETSDNGLKKSNILKTYKDFAGVFTHFRFHFLLLHLDENCAIELDSGKTPLLSPFFNFSERQVEVLLQSIDQNIANRFIGLLTSSVRPLILFISQTDGTLRLFVNYCRLNAIIIKN